jgi:putative hydrolase of the HAD superfamily
MARRIRGVLLDLYGTLAYIPSEAYVAAKDRMASIAGCDPAKFLATWRSLTTASTLGELATTEDRVRETLRRIGTPSITERDLSQMVEIEETLQIEAVQLIPGVPDMLKELRAKGVHLGLVSNCSSSAATLPMKLGLENFFDTMILSYQVHLVKPDPRIYILACQRLALSPSMALFAGDGDCHELEGAQAAGMIAVLVMGTETLMLHVEESSSYDYAVASIDQLPTLVEQLNSAN